MGLINFKNIDFNKSINKENKIIEFNGSEIQVVNYLSIHDKYDLIMITLQKSFDDGIYNDLKLGMYFNLNLVYLYTNIMFDAEDRADEEALYDTLKNSGLLEKILEAIDDEEIEELWTVLKMIEAKLKDYKGNFYNFIMEAINRLPEKAEKAMAILKEMDPELIKSFSGGPLNTIMNGVMNSFEPKTLQTPITPKEE